MMADAGKIKKCARCGKWKSLTEYNHSHTKGKFYRQPYCRTCQHEYAAANRSDIGCESRDITCEAKAVARREDYSLLYAYYKTYRKKLDEYTNAYGDDNLMERMDFEYMSGL